MWPNNLKKRPHSQSGCDATATKGVGGVGGLCVITNNVGCLPIIRRCWNNANWRRVRRERRLTETDRQIGNGNFNAGTTRRQRSKGGAKTTVYSTMTRVDYGWGIALYDVHKILRFSDTLPSTVPKNMLTSNLANLLCDYTSGYLGGYHIWWLIFEMW